MISHPILLMGGTGAIGRLTARALRSVYPDVPLLIGGRDLLKSRSAAGEIGRAEGVLIDKHADDLGLGDRQISAVAIFYTDERLASLRFAQSRRVPHLGISSGVYEIAPEVATYMHAPDAAAVVLGYEWLVGATTVATFTCAKPFARLHEITIGALVDEQDGGGPAVAEDFERLNRMMPAALTRRDGSYIWRSEEDAKAEFHAIDGTRTTATGFSSIDVAGLAAATGAPNVQFNIATGVSTSRRRGEPKSTEIIIELAGEGHDGQPLYNRYAVFHPGGAAPLTALGVSMILERLIGLDGNRPTPAGLYFPFQVLDHATYLSRLHAEGGSIVPLDAS
ncbi:NAD(P)-dependent oxidoreductase [Agrobacterium genomosp. 3 str. CIP 111-78]|uniref:NAD(P)-dependent oxidoreductase n=1 Tax=Agrobacterium tumefaciens TaxID=358 RepID=A0AAE6EKL3_AGRTU|nr:MULTISPECIES: NAD(P)-dependent oxidoreductase [Agrobacterium tumefaciens complex]MCA2371382.1 NAD(P)-dependent oxidoreductase [Agrobacterium tomkonis CIP 111-78]QCM00721.1 NAD(P)-dependent oxidoreductase [Agrobacterium tumefaciens]